MIIQIETLGGHLILLQSMGHSMIFLSFFFGPTGFKGF